MARIVILLSTPLPTVNISSRDYPIVLTSTVIYRNDVSNVSIVQSNTSIFL